MSLYYINLQIGNHQNAIYSFNQQLEQKRENLNRLEKVLTQLINDEGDLQQNTRFCTAPELSSNTWHGQLATEFQSFRTGELVSTYKSISSVQLSGTINDLENEIKILKREIGDLRENISFRQSRLNGLYEQRREEQLKEDE